MEKLFESIKQAGLPVAFSLAGIKDLSDVDLAQPGSREALEGWARGKGMAIEDGPRPDEVTFVESLR